MAWRRARVALRDVGSSPLPPDGMSCSAMGAPEDVEGSGGSSSGLARMSPPAGRTKSCLGPQGPLGGPTGAGGGGSGAGDADGAASGRGPEQSTTPHPLPRGPAAQALLLLRLLLFESVALAAAAATASSSLLQFSHAP